MPRNIRRHLQRLIFTLLIIALFAVVHAYQDGKFDNLLGQSQTQKNLPGHTLYGHKEAADPSDCTLVKNAVAINIDPSRYPATAKHAEDAIKAGEPKVLHLDREAPDENRKYSLAGVATKPGDDRDEYPPAATMEGGQGADIRLIPSADNRGAGSSMGAQLSGFCSGQAFVLTYVPGG